jgi:hypothetical protein
MATELRTISAADLPTVVAIFNQSSAGHTFEFRLNLMNYLNLSRFWNFSYETSYLACSDGEPAGVLMNCVDKESLEAFSYYWGVLPQYRKTRLSIGMVRTYLARLKDNGFTKAYGMCSIDSPIEIYLKLGFHEAFRLLELRADTKPQYSFQDVQRIDVGDLVAELASFPVVIAPWVRRPSFFQNAAPFLEFFGVRANSRLEAWMVLTRWTNETSIVAFDWLPGAEHFAKQLLGHLSTFPLPFVATHVVEGDRLDHFLRQHNFVPATERTCIALDLATYLPKS